MMSAWIVWTLTGIGVTYAITESSILALLRIMLSKLGFVVTTLVYCAACTGFWAGAALGWVGAFPWETAPSQFAEIVISAVCMMAVTASWSAWKGGNPMYAIEQGRDHERKS